MARGKKSSPELIYKIMELWFVTGSMSETARRLEIPANTVCDIVNANKDKEEFVKLRDEKAREFADRASELINKGLILLDRRFDRALAFEEELDFFIDEISSVPKAELSQDEKNRLIKKLRDLQLQDVKAITTAIGTLYDKRALARGESTGNTKISFDLPEELVDLAE